MQRLTHRANATRSPFLNPQLSEEPEFLLEEEQEELIKSLKVSNDKADCFFRSILVLFSASGIVSQIASMIYRQQMMAVPYPDSKDNPFEFNQSISPIFGASSSLISFGIGIFVIRHSSQIKLSNLIIWAFISFIPLALMIEATEFSFELFWWSIPMLLQIADISCLWIMKGPDEGFFQLEKSQYKLKGA